jgi:prepilin-type N-terminal cleavage/methylation domain-containing protein
MWLLRRSDGNSRRSGRKAFTLVEVIVSIMVVGIMLAGLLSLYTQSAVRADWSAHSLAGQMMALRGLEQTRAARWDPRAAAPVDELVATNFPPVVDVLDLGPSGGGRYPRNQRNDHSNTFYDSSAQGSSCRMHMVLPLEKQALHEHNFHLPRS